MLVTTGPNTQVPARPAAGRRPALRFPRSRGRWEYQDGPQQPAKLASSWVKVPSVELDGSRRNDPVPVPPRGVEGRAVRIQN